MDECILEMRHISKNFGGVQALKDVQFSLKRGEIHCLVGENGSGKSTLIKIISGVISPEPGAHIAIQGHHVAHLTPGESIARGIQVIYQDLSLFPNLTVAENIGGTRHLREGLLVNWRKVRSVATEAMTKIGVRLDPDRLVRDLSIADRQIVAICRALAFDAKLVIMDEPTASLTRTEVNALLEVVQDLQRKEITTLFVSHRLDEVIEIAQRVTILRDGEKVGVFPVDELDNQKLALLMTGKKISYARIAGPSDTGDVLLEVKGLSKESNYRDISFTLHRGEVLGIIGLLGSGRTELALSLFGMNPPDWGQVLLEGKPLSLRSNRDAIVSGIAYVPEDRIGQGLVMPQPVTDNVVVTVMKRLCGRLGLLDLQKRRDTATEWVQGLGIKIPSYEAPVQTLSGGNQQRVVLAKWMATEPRVLILDSPTVGIDVAAKSGIYDLIRKLASSGIGIILISDEVPEVLHNSHRVLIMRKGRIVETLDASQTTEKELSRKIHVA